MAGERREGSSKRQLTAQRSQAASVNGGSRKSREWSQPRRRGRGSTAHCGHAPSPPRPGSDLRRVAACCGVCCSSAQRCGFPSLVSRSQSGCGWAWAALGAMGRGACVRCCGGCNGRSGWHRDGEAWMALTQLSRRAWARAPARVPPPKRNVSKGPTHQQLWLRARRHQHLRRGAARRWGRAVPGWRGEARRG